MGYLYLYFKLTILYTLRQSTCRVAIFNTWGRTAGSIIFSGFLSACTYVRALCRLFDRLAVNFYSSTYVWYASDLPHEIVKQRDIIVALTFDIGCTDWLTSACGVIAVHRKATR